MIFEKDIQMKTPSERMIAASATTSLHLSLKSFSIEMDFNENCSQILIIFLFIISSVHSAGKLDYTLKLECVSHDFDTLQTNVYSKPFRTSSRANRTPFSDSKPTRY